MSEYIRSKRQHPVSPKALEQAKGLRDSLSRVLKRRLNLDHTDWKRFKLPIVHLSVGALQPEVVVENRPAWIEFTLYNGTDRAYSGFVDLSALPTHSIDPVSGNWTYPIRDLQSGETVKGVIAFTAPRADRGNQLTVRFVEVIPTGREADEYVVQASVDDTFDVAGRYSLVVDQIRINHTAAYHEDSVVVSIGGGTDDQQFPQQTAALGNHNDGTIAVRLPGVGPFHSVNGVSSDAALVFVVANAGHSSDEDTARDTLNMISTISRAITTVVMTVVFGAGELWAAISAGVDQLMHYFHNTLFADCDTITAFGIEQLTSQRLYDDTYDPLDHKTESTPVEEEFAKKKGDRLLDMFGGGCQDSRYRVRWKVVRHRQPDEVLSLHTEPGFLTPIRLGYDARTRVQMVTPADVVVQWEDIGGLPKSVDQLGNVRTPLTGPAATSPVRTEYIIARARGLVDGLETYWGVAFILFGDAAS